MKFWRKIKTTLLALGVSLLLITSPSFAFDKNLSDEAKAKFEQTMVKPDSYYTFVTVQAQGTAEVLFRDSYSDKWVQTETYWTQRGSGTVVQPGWILTAAHVVEPEYVEVVQGRVSTFVTLPLKIHSTTVLIRDYKDCPHIAWVHYIDRERDVALLRYVPHGFLEPLSSEYGTGIRQNIYGSELEVGDTLAIITHTRNEDGTLDYRVRIKWGTVVNTGPTAPSQYAHAWLSPSDFTMDIPLQGGDSGSLVFIFDNGKPYFVGIARAVYNDHIVYFSYAAWIGDIVDRILSMG